MKKIFYLGLLIFAITGVGCTTISVVTKLPAAIVGAIDNVMDKPVKELDYNCPLLNKENFINLSKINFDNFDLHMQRTIEQNKKIIRLARRYKTIIFPFHVYPNGCLASDKGIDLDVNIHVFVNYDLIFDNNKLVKFKRYATYKINNNDNIKIFPYSAIIHYVCGKINFVQGLSLCNQEFAENKFKHFEEGIKRLKAIENLINLKSKSSSDIESFFEE